MSIIIPNNYVLTKQKAQNKLTADREEDAKAQHKLELEIVQDPEEAIFRVKDFEIAKMVGAALCHKYPNHGWQVEADSRNGIAKIFMSQMSSSQGYIYKLKDISLGTFDREMMRVGGEMLERFSISRGRFNEDSIKNVMRDPRGNAIADLS